MAASHRPRRRRMRAIAVALALAVAGCRNAPSSSTPAAQPDASTRAADTHAAAGAVDAGSETAAESATKSPMSAPAAPSGNVRFAAYTVPPVTTTASLAPYTVAPGLANVKNAEDFALSAAAKDLIAQNAFAAQFPQDEAYKQFYQLYEDGRYKQKPIFVTTDSVLHVYHLLFDKLLRDVETRHLIAAADALTMAMLDASQAQLTAVEGTAAEGAAKRNLAYFAVAAQLSDPSRTPPAVVRDVVDAELALIDAHAGRGPSNVFGTPQTEYMEDYGQYKPRGHYTRSPELERYFRTMMWYGRMTFRLKDDDETRSALLLTQALASATTPDGVPAVDLWAQIYEPTVFFVGGADDLSYFDYAPLMDQALGAGADAAAVADDAALARFKELAKELAGPRINSMFVWIGEDKEEVTKGLRMMGQRFTLDEYVFGQLIWRNVGTSLAENRGLPKGLDVPAAFGSETAYDILEAMGETTGPANLHYPEQMEKVRREIAGLPDAQWSENLYWTWLSTFRPLLVPKAADSGYPSFMTNDAWTRKNVNTVLGSWTELKHDTILYAKQVMTEMGGGPPELPKGYVEPEPAFYARIAALIAMTRDGLSSRGLLDPPAESGPPGLIETLDDLEHLALDLKAISEKELAGQALSEDEYTLIAYYGGRLERLTAAASDAGSGEDPNGWSGSTYDQDAAVVADVATGGDGALTEGTGRIMPLYVVVPIEGELVLARGGIYSQYEFVQPSGDRLTNEQWRARLDAGEAPKIDTWKTFVVR